jgi:hypothetical protein
MFASISTFTLVLSPTIRSVETWIGGSLTKIHSGAFVGAGGHEVSPDDQYPNSGSCSFDADSGQWLARPWRAASQAAAATVAHSKSSHSGHPSDQSSRVAGKSDPIIETNERSTRSFARGLISRVRKLVLTGIPLLPRGRFENVCQRSCLGTLQIVAKTSALICGRRRGTYSSFAAASA